MKNIAGIKCSNKFLADSSSKKIVRHFTGECGCNAAKGTRCKAAKPRPVYSTGRSFTPHGKNRRRFGYGFGSDTHGICRDKVAVKRYFGS